MRLVLDTNVVIAAFATHGLCHLLFESVLVHHKFLMSHALLNEVSEKLTKKLKLPEARAREITTLLKHQSILLKDKSVPGLDCRDPDDIRVLALAVNGKADAIVTGDQDLLVLKSVEGIPILTPRELWELLRQTKSEG